MKIAKPSLLIAFVMVVAGLTVFGVGFGPAYAGFKAQGKADICPQCNQDGTWNVPSGPSGGGGTPTPSGPSPAELEAERRAAQQQQMLDTNDKGLRHSRAGEHELAVEAFREALALCTRESNCEVIRRNVANAQSWIDEKNAEAERQRQEAERQRQEAERQRQVEEAKQAIGGMLDDLASQWGASGSGETGGLGFMSSDDNTAINAGDNDDTTGSLQFMGSGQSLFSRGTKDSAPPLAFGDPNRKLAGEPLKDSVAPVRKRQLAAVDVNRLAASVKAKPSAGKANPRTEVFLDALEVGKDDWAKSYRYLQEARKKYPDNLAIRDAKSFFEGLTSSLDEVAPLYFEELRKMTADIMFSQMAGREGAEKQAEIDYETWALVERAYAQLGKGKENKVSDYQAANRLFKEAQKRNPDHLGIRDSANFFEGALYREQMGLRTTAAQ